MGTPSRDESVDDARFARWLALHEEESPIRAEPTPGPATDHLADPLLDPLTDPAAEPQAVAEDLDDPLADPVNDPSPETDAGPPPEVDAEPEPENDLALLSISTDGFTPSAPVDVFAALRDDPVEQALTETAPITDAAIIPTPEAAAPSGDEAPVRPITPPETKAGSKLEPEPLPPESQVEPEPTPVRDVPGPEPEPGEGPAFETLEELLNAATAATHPPAPLQAFEDDDPSYADPAFRRGPTASTAADEAPQERPTPARPTPEKARPEAPEPAASGPTTPKGPPPGTPTPKSPPPGTPAAGITESQHHETIEFSPRQSNQQALLVLFLVGLAATVLLAWLALQGPSTTSVALAAVAAVVTFTIWSRYASAAPATVVVQDGELDIRTRDSHHRFDLASGRTAYDVEGSPGSRGWKVLIHRTGMPAYVVDASMVDPEKFTEVLDRYRSRSSAG